MGGYILKTAEYNCEEIDKDGVAEVLVNNIIQKMENGIYDEVPKQNILIQELRNAGWDEKVRVGEYCNHAIDGILGGVGVCGYFGHSQGAFLKILALQSLFEDNKIRECYYITQSAETAELRHRLVNPKARPGTNGNRVTFDNLIDGMGYYHRFITVPMTIISVDIGIENIH